MSITHKSTWAGLPSTSRGVPVHLSYDKKSDRIAYASNRSVFLRSVTNPGDTIQYTNHTAKVTVAKFAPSGFYVASGDEHGNVKVWDCVGEDQVTKGEYHAISGRINDIAWDADSSRIIAVGDGKERFGHCFSADSGNSVGEISGHTAVVNAAAIRPVRPYKAVTVADDNNMIFYNGPPFRFSFTSRDFHSNFVHDVQFSPDGEFIASVSADKKIVLYDGKTGEHRDTIENAHEGGIFALSWSPDSKSIATSSADGSVKLFDVESKQAKQTWTLPKSLENQQVGVVFAGGERIVSLTYGGDLYYWTQASSEPERIVHGHQMGITSVAITSDSNIITGSAEGRLCQWVGSDAELVSGSDSNSGRVVSMAVSNDAKTAFSVSWDDTLKSIQSGKIATTTPLQSQPLGVSHANDITAVVTENEVTLYDNSGKQLKSQKLSYDATSVGISKELVAVGDSRNNIHLLSTSDLSEVGQLPPLRSPPSYLAFSPSDAKHLAVGDRTGKITLYNVPDKAVVTSRWGFHTGVINSIAWHPSGEYVVSGSLDTNIFVYSVKTPGKNIKFMGAHKEGVSGVAWTGDNSVVSVGADACVKHWNVTFHS